MQRAFIDSNDKICLSDSAIKIEGKGDITVGATQVELTFSGVTKTIRIQASEANTGIIYIGLTGVLANDTNEFAKLSAGEELVFDYTDEANPIFLISDTAAQSVNAGATLCR